MPPDLLPEDFRRVLRQEMERARVYDRAALVNAGRYYRIEDVAAILQVSSRQVQKWIASGKLSFRKIDGHQRISGEALDRDLDALFSER